MFDYHIHSSFSGDSEMDIMAAVEKAVQIGLKEIAITDHLDYLWPDKSTMFEMIEPDKYHKAVEDANKVFGNRITVKKGIEIGIQPDCIAQSKKFLEGWNYDFVILSIHCVDGMDISEGIFYQGKTPEEAFKRYYEEVLFAVNHFEQFNVIGHLDFIRRYIPDPFFKKPVYSCFYEIIDKILKTLISKNKGIEVNTSGFRYGLNSFTPEFELVKRYKKLGGSIITVGSDSHSPEYVGSNINQAVELIKSAGFKHITLFNNMNPHFYKL